MAPFSRGRISHGKIVKRQTKSRKNVRSKNTFASSRLKDTETEDYELGPLTLEPEEGDVHDRDVQYSTDESSLDDGIGSNNAYSSLLQSFTTAVPKASKLQPDKQNVSRFSSDNLQNPEVLSKSSQQPPDIIRSDTDDESHNSDINEQLYGNETNHIADDSSFDQHFCLVDSATLQQHENNVQAAAVTTSTSDLSPNWKATLYSTGASGREQILDATAPFGRAFSTWGMKQRLQKAGEHIHTTCSGVEVNLANLIFSHKDILFCGRTSANAVKIRELACLHALNHILKTRDRILKHNEYVQQGMDIDDQKLCDQGFTRPKALFILPTRKACYDFLTTLISLYKPEQQENRKRFQDTYGDPGIPIPNTQPDDFHDLFEGNDDDMFRVGLKLTRKSAKYFSKFYSSDIIFASPLGLRMAIGDEGSKKQDYDFLSSIELVVMDQAQALLMQNWEHVEYVFDRLNLQPKEAHGCDFGRVRPWYLDGKGKYVRQTVVLTAYNTPEVNNFFNSRFLNFSGKIKISNSACKGLISSPDALFKQIFYRFEAVNPNAEPDARFKYFTAKIIPQLAKRARQNQSISQGVLIYIPSYTDFVRVRNLFTSSTTTRDISFGCISEYIALPEVARARSHFSSGRHAVLLYTGRVHHFRRYQLKGTKHVIFYGLPDNPIFYKEVSCDFPARSVAAGKIDALDVVVEALFSQWDALRLERIVGTNRLRSMIMERTGDIFEFIP